MDDTKKPNWILRAVLGCATVFVLALLVTGFVVYRWVTDPERQAAMSTLMEIGNRPGSAELRALGCDHGVIQTAEELKLFVRALGGDENSEDLPAELLVFCRLELRTEAEPSCDAVAEAYASAGEAVPERFFVQVHRQAFPETETLCEALYDRSGTFVREVHFSGRTSAR